MNARAEHKARIITIGDEILIGQIVDSNSAWIAQRLNLHGIHVEQIVTISDKKEDIIKALDEAKLNADLIILTGGLGPTKDDITKKTLSTYFKSPLKRNQEVESFVREIFQKFKRPILESNLEQADLPERAEVLWNALGTAPGMLFRDHGKIYVSMPGVPYEMKYVFSNGLEPIIQSEIRSEAIEHKTIMTAGIGESFIAEKISDFENSLPENIKLAYLPRPGMVRLRLSAAGSSSDVLKNQLSDAVDQVLPLLGHYHYGFDEISLSEVIGNKLRARQLKLSVAESCTGGRIANLITSTPGSSDYFDGSLVTYSNQLKRDVLGVQESTLKEYGAVSEETAIEMAKGLKRVTNSDYCLSVTGIAGPGGGSEEKPVGTVWVALDSPSGLQSRMLSLGNKRTLNIERASMACLFLIWKAIVKPEPT